MRQTPRSHVLHGLVYAVVVVGYLYLLARLFEVPFTEPYLVASIVSGTYAYLALNRYDLTEPWRYFRPGSTGNRMLMSWTVLVGLLLLVALLTKYSAYFSRRLMVAWMLTTPLMLALLHYLVRHPLRRLFPSLAVTRRAVLVYVNESSRALAERLRRSENFVLVGYFEDRVDQRQGCIEGVDLLGRAQDVVPYVRKHGIDVVFVVLPDGSRARAIQLIEDLGDTTASVYYVPDLLMFFMLRTQISEIEGMPAIEVAETPFYGADGLLKRVFDIAFSLLVLVLLSPLLAAIAVAVKLSSPGPVLFKQKRYGLNGRPYSVYKFRSMVVGDDLERQRQQATRDDPRVTRVGRVLRRTSLDELPQFCNVLRGDMSVVGPRPHSVEHNEHYRKEIKRYMVRHKVRPGLTGWAQVHGLRGETAQLERMEERIQYDLEYIRTWSPVLDLRIILMTVSMVFGHKQAY